MVGSKGESAARDLSCDRVNIPLRGAEDPKSLKNLRYNRQVRLNHGLPTMGHFDFCAFPIDTSLKLLVAPCFRCQFSNLLYNP